MEEENEIAIGIDLGTTYSVVGIYSGFLGPHKGENLVEIIRNEYGDGTTPSSVTFYKENVNATTFEEKAEQYIIGKKAKDLSANRPDYSFYEFKRLMGLDPSSEQFEQSKKRLTFKIVNNNEKVNIELPNRTLISPEFLSSLVLNKLKKMAESFVNRKITKAVITVPAYFNDSQRQATIDAGKLAGLEVLRIISEPTAAALAYRIEKNSFKNIIIFDFGGGTLDVTVLRVITGESDKDVLFEVLSTSGNSYLGGEDIDNNLRNYCLSEFCKLNNLQESNITKKVLIKLKALCESAKIELTYNDSANIFYEDILFDNGKSYNIDLVIEKETFISLSKQVFDDCMIEVNKALDDASLKTEEIDDVVLVGGSTKIPFVKEMLNKKFPNKIRNVIDPDKAVGYGAAIQAAILSKVIKEDEEIKNISLVDVTPLSIGISTAGGVMKTLISRNTRIPAIFAYEFVPKDFNQSDVCIEIYQGERDLVKYNHFLGSFELVGLTLKENSKPIIDVVVTVNEDGIVNISASDKLSGNSNSITIVDNRKELSQEEIQKMINEAELNKDLDKEEKERILNTFTSKGSNKESEDN